MPLVPNEAQQWNINSPALASGWAPRPAPRPHPPCAHKVAGLFKSLVSTGATSGWAKGFNHGRLYGPPTRLARTWESKANEGNQEERLNDALDSLLDAMPTMRGTPRY